MYKLCVWVSVKKKRGKLVSKSRDGNRQLEPLRAGFKLLDSSELNAFDQSMTVCFIAFYVCYKEKYTYTLTLCRFLITLRSVPLKNLRLEGREACTLHPTSLYQQELVHPIP